MRRIRIIHKLRTVTALLGFLAVLAGIGTLWWANRTGLPESWRAEIERALARQGLHAEVASLRFSPLRGIEASEVVIYSDATRGRVFARLHQLVFDVDKSRLSSGDLRIDRLDLTGARISLAADPADPNSRALEISDARGRIQMSEERLVEIHDASGMLGGVRLELEAELLVPRPGTHLDVAELERQRAERRRLVNRTIDLLNRWGPQGAEPPPLLRVTAQGDLEDPSTYRARIRLRGGSFRTLDLDVKEVSADADLRGSAVVVQNLRLRTPHGSADGRIEYDLAEQAGHFELRSSLDPRPLLSGLHMPVPESLPRFGGPPQLDIHGSFARGEDGWNQQLIGHAILDRPEFHGLSVDRFEADFSWDGRRTFLEDIRIAKDGRKLDGRVFITPDKVRYQAETDLAVSFWQQAVNFQPLSDVLDDFGETPDTRVTVRCAGHASPDDPHDWHFSGTADGVDIAFRGVPARRAKVTMDLDAAKLDFTDGEVEFDYDDYALRKAHGGRASGELQVGRIRYDHEPSTVTIERLRGRAWPAPVVRTFAAEVADELEVYAFHQPPALEADGVVGIGDGSPAQDLRVSFASTDPADYRFLDATLTLAQPSGVVRVLPDRVHVGDLVFGLFGGFLRGDLTAMTGGDGTIRGETDWTDLSLPELAAAYDFESRPKGRITGRIDFTLHDADIAGLDGSGHMGLTDGELFAVPVFGPLSPVIAKVLGRKGAGFQEAKDAFLTFDVKKGVVSSNDFMTTTSSLVFTGDGVADLTRRTLEMTVRMNARGLLGVITLPLRPFYGLFQFRGSGPIEDPQWKNVAFTSPPKDQEKVLLEPPRARVVPVPPRDAPAPPKRRR